MWAAPMPYYSEYGSSRRKGSTSQNQNASCPNPASSQNPAVDFAQLLEPAIDGPPSPERIRQLSKQMKRASHLNRPQQGHRAASSASSSLRSSTGERLAWESALENMSVARRSSQRSTSSSNPPRERHDSVQVLGKNIFHRRGKSKRESSSSGSSMYSGETPAETALPPRKESIIPTIFTRRKSRDDSAPLQKKLNISGPFNFQHVTHTQRDHLPNKQRGNRLELATEFSTMRSASVSSPSGIAGPMSDHIPYRNLSSEAINEQQDIPQTAPIFRPPLYSRQTAPPGPRRLLKHAVSQDQLRISPPRPPRPPRSPLEPLEASPPVPPVPAQVSSRQAMHPDGDDQPGTMFSERPFSGFRRPQPFDPDEDLGPTDMPPARSHGSVAQDSSEELGPKDESRYSHALTTPDDAAWPLSNSGATSFERPLPDVPEEEEQYAVTGRARGSPTSVSSLRGSCSVPVLRTLSRSQRPMSGTSDTLGPFDLGNSRRVTSDNQTEGPVFSPLRDSWEDDIDYCYEHEADANFEYEWERPSLDGGRDFMAPPVQVAFVDDELMEANSGNAAPLSPGMLSASRPEAPGLSPSSQTSAAAGHETVAPSSNLGVASNFSLPRADKSRRPSQLRHSRAGSQASSFKESHGFTLSPSLLIPTDYHQQMLLSEAERLAYEDDDEEFLTHKLASISYEDGTLMSHQSPMMDQRASTSTMATNSTSLSDSTGERHISTNSTWTSLTRLTSNTSLNKMEASFSDASEAPLGDQNDEDMGMEAISTTVDENDTVPELTPFPPAPLSRKSNHKSHASESVAHDDLPPLKSIDAPKNRRSRARTASLGGQAPPVGQYALFPKAYVKATGDRI